MGYRTVLGVVTDEKGIKTILESAAGKKLQGEYGIEVYQVEPGNRYHFMLEDTSIGELVDIGLFRILERLEYREVLLIEDETEYVEHYHVWPKSLPDELKIPYLAMKSECTLSRYVAVKKMEKDIKK